MMKKVLGHRFGVRVFLSLLGCLIVALLPALDQFYLLKAYPGQSYLTQATDNADYDRHFGANWQSVRTFRLMQNLDRPLRIYVDQSPQQEGLYQQQYMSYVVESVKVWAKALDGRLRYQFVDSPQKSDVEVYWVSGFQDPLTAGLTNYRVGHAKIQIKTVGVPDSDIRTNVMHEFGHAFGISGHSGSQSDIMVGMRRWKNYAYTPKLSQSDVQAIQRLYSLDWQKGEDLYTAVKMTRPSQQPIVARP